MHSKWLSKVSKKVQSSLLWTSLAKMFLEPPAHCNTSTNEGDWPPIVITRVTLLLIDQSLPICQLKICQSIPENKPRKEAYLINLHSLKMRHAPQQHKSTLSARIRKREEKRSLRCQYTASHFSKDSQSDESGRIVSHTTPSSRGKRTAQSSMVFQ